MENSSSWLTALLDRPVDEEAGPKPLSWLPDPDAAQSGFVEGMPFERSPGSQKVPSKPLLQAERDTLPLETTGPSETKGDGLVDILREALGETDAETPDLDLAADLLVEEEPEREPEPDPINEAFMRGKVAGKEEAAAEHKALSSQKLKLRQSIRALDQAGMDALASDLSETVIALCSQAIEDYSPDPGALQQRCAAAAARLGARVTGAKLRLHPDDLALLEESSLSQWEVVADPTAERGGVQFETEDGSVSDRPSDWRRAIAAAIRG